MNTSRTSLPAHVEIIRALALPPDAAVDFEIDPERDGDVTTIQHPLPPPPPALALAS